MFEFLLVLVESFLELFPLKLDHFLVFGFEEFGHLLALFRVAVVGVAEEGLEVFLEELWEVVSAGLAVVGDVVLLEVGLDFGLDCC